MRASAVSTVEQGGAMGLVDPAADPPADPAAADAADPPADPAAADAADRDLVSAAVSRRGDPGLVPVDTAAWQVDLRLAGLAAGVALRRHCQRQRVVLAPSARRPSGGTGRM